MVVCLSPLATPGAEFMGWRFSITLVVDKWLERCVAHMKASMMGLKSVMKLPAFSKFQQKKKEKGKCTIQLFKCLHRVLEPAVTHLRRRVVLAAASAVVLRREDEEPEPQVQQGQVELNKTGQHSIKTRSLNLTAPLRAARLSIRLLVFSP